LPGGCDNCLTPRETFDGTLHAQKFLSCVYRIRQKSGFGFGLNHVVEVLIGADSEAIRKWGHQEISAYGIGRDAKRAEWQAYGRELIRLGLLDQQPGKFVTVDLSARASKPSVPAAPSPSPASSTASRNSAANSPRPRRRARRRRARLHRLLRCSKHAARNC
jgi:superfamily II DNA helicase RecQ